MSQNPASASSTAWGERELRNRGSERHLRDLLQSVLAAEILRPSAELWLVSPWVSDIPVLDNRTSAFQTLAPGWERSTIRLSQVLAHLAERGTQLHIATRDDPHNLSFETAMKDAALWMPDRVHWRTSSVLHEKGLVTDTSYLSGSFNFTFSGIEINEEVAHFYTHPQKVAEAKIAFSDRWQEGTL